MRQNFSVPNTHVGNILCKMSEKSQHVIIKIQKPNLAQNVDLKMTDRHLVLVMVVTNLIQTLPSASTFIE